MAGTASEPPIREGHRQRQQAPSTQDPLSHPYTAANGHQTLPPSPHTNRVIKKGRMDADPTGSEAETTPTTPNRTQTKHPDAAQPATSTPTLFSFAVWPPGLIDCISEQLQSSLDLAARITVKPNTNDIQPLIALIQRLLNTLTTPAADLVAPLHKETKQTKNPTYTEATKAPQQSPPPKGAHHASQTHLPHTSKYGDKRPQKTTRSTRLVLDFSHSEVPPAPPPANLAPPAQICAAFNKYLPETQSVKAVTWTRNGNWPGPVYSSRTEGV
ncbi:hypothetical protein C8R45DRAFT_1088493 [Mycena sanguinolenta]|nr:hypothetical protein C8R45DRAFT_1088493 [Mycena sanguinolenta]